MHIALLTALVFVASALATVTGFGLSTVTIPWMIIFFPLHITLLFVGIIHAATDIWKILFFRHALRYKLILTFGIPGIAASYLGASLLFESPLVLLQRTLGLFFIAYVVLLLLHPSLRMKPSVRNAVTGGAASGFLAGIFGIGGALRSLFLSAFDLPKAVYIATTGAIALAIDTTRITTYLTKGTRLEIELLLALIICIPTSLLGARAGKAIVDRIPQKHFRRVVAAMLFILGAKMLLWPT
jgi:uncharacterized membrane protein YfcA